MNVTRTPSVAPSPPVAADRPGPTPGRALVWASWVGTAVSCVTSVANALTGDRDHYALSAVPALVLFALGCAAFLAAFALAVGRSREEQIGVGGLFFLQGCDTVRK